MNTAPAPMPAAYDSGDTAWLLASTAMVLLMTPGLAFFYGGMVRTQHILMVIKMSFAALAFGTLVWWVIGYSLAFGPDVGGAGLIGNLDHVFMRGIELNTLTGHVPTYVFSTFQMGFAIITVALISGSIADRATMKGWLVFVVLWLLIVYIPLAHWVFDQGGSSSTSARWTSPAVCRWNSTPGSPGSPSHSCCGRRATSPAARSGPTTFRSS